jgi:Conserved TM helix
MNDSLAVPVVASSAVGDALRSVALFVPKFVAFLAILVVGWLVARLLRTAVDKVLDRVGFDRWVERGGIKAALARSKYDASDIVAKLVYYALLLFTLQLAFGVWGPNPVSDLIRGVVAWLPKALVAIIIVVVATAIASAVRDIVGNALGGLTYGRALANVSSWFIIGIGVIAALNQVGVATTVTTPILIAVLATIAGVLVVGVGGGLVRPMQQRWEGWLDRAGEESGAIAERAKAYAAGQRDAAAADQPTSATGSAPVPRTPAEAPVSEAPTPGARADAPSGAGSVAAEEPAPPKYATGTASPGGAARSAPVRPTAVFPKQPSANDDPTMIIPPANPRGPGDE